MPEPHSVVFHAIEVLPTLPWRWPREGFSFPRFRKDRKWEREMSNFEYIETGGAPIKAWTKGVPVEDQALSLIHI